MISIGVVIAIGLAVRPAIPFLIARDPLALELLTGDLFAVGAAAAFARFGSIPLWEVIVAGVIGMLKFDWIIWWAGKRWGEGMVRMISTPQQARRWSTRARSAHPALLHGAVLVAWLPGVPSAVVFAIAGLSGMRLATFLFLDTCGAVILTTLVSSLGFTLGQAAIDVVLAVDRYAALVSIIIIIVAIAVPALRTGLVRRRRNVRPLTEPGETEHRDDTDTY